jgi:hypothetical protein
VTISVRRTPVQLRPGSTRVLGRPHVPGDEPGATGPTRVERIVTRVRALAAEQVAAELADVVARFAGRHRDLDLMLARNAERAQPQLEGCTPEQCRLVGAYLTQEHAFESAALTNPSMVSAPDQSGVEPGSLRFLLSLRAIGEGHLSSITFRSGVVDADGGVVVDELGPAGRDRRAARRGARAAPVHAQAARAGRRRRLHRPGDGPAAAPLHDRGPRAGPHGARGPAARRHAREREADALAGRPPTTSEVRRGHDAAGRAPHLAGGPVREPRHGGRPLRALLNEDGSSTYYATYTAYDGFTILPQLLETNDFTRFEVSTLTGRSALNKGMALFPRAIDGRYVALSRPDRENIHLLRSDDVRSWESPSVLLRKAQQPWEAIQMGNCGSPIETEQGWLVLTHGVGPMRTYRIGALLLDLDHPERILADLPDPILEATTTSATATSRTSSTPAAGCGTATTWCCPTARRTRAPGRHAVDRGLLAELDAAPV